MFLNSLRLTDDDLQRERICDQLDKIEKQVLLDTNSEYEEEYLTLLSKKTKYIDEEKNRLKNIISLIIARGEYLDKRKNEHKNVTGSLVELTSFLGEDKLDSYKKRLEIIEKYEENKVVQEKLIKEMKVIDVKISEASRNVKANTRLNESLEKKMISLVGSALEKQGLYKLIEKKEEILKKHAEFKYALALAKDNLKSATELSDSKYILECNNMLNEINLLYTKYNEDINIINLINIYDKKTSNYDELIEKRKNIDVILKNIIGTELYKIINPELSKQYNTIKLEGNDIKNYEFLKAEREKRNKILCDIDEENSSKEFKNVLEELVKNENRQKEEQVKKARHEEQLERQKKIQEEQKVEAARVRRQKLIEEARFKEQQEAMAKMKKLQDETVIKREKQDEKVGLYDVLPKDEDLLEEKVEIKNPLKNKTLEEVMSFTDDFNTDELFENTKITPNKPLGDSLFKKAENNIDIPLWDIPEEEIEKTLEEQENKADDKVDEIKEELVEDNYASLDNTNLFKEENTTKEVVAAKEEKVEEKRESIYDLLENNSNIIWKTTDTSSNNKKIPVIGNNKLKPEIISDNQGVSFPDLKKKEGEVLWKETL